MKAIQIKYLAVTNTKPGRWKVWAEGTKPFITSIHNDQWNSANPQEELALEYINQQGWNVSINGIGVLSNGDYVVTLKQRDC